jgi:hypothetical protein
MSYTVAIVVPPIPADDPAAWAALDGLIEQQGPRPHLFQALHDRLTAKYPCIDSLSDDEIDDAVWSDGPLINNFGHCAAVLGLSFSRVEEALPFLIQTSKEMGLVVFDWQTKTLHRA